VVLADFGADVIRIDRPGSKENTDITSRLVSGYLYIPEYAVTFTPEGRAKRSICLNTKSELGKRAILKLIAGADVVIDPYRPGVLERLGLGPETVERASSGKAILARMTGFRRTGPYASMAGHDINYIALGGVLSVGSYPHISRRF
jgi:alpha-methylacyl-CoA racemase